jgi:hypothetical protein
MEGILGDRSLFLSVTAGLALIVLNVAISRRIAGA